MVALTLSAAPAHAAPHETAGPPEHAGPPPGLDGPGLHKIGNIVKLDGAPGLLRVTNVEEKTETIVRDGQEIEVGGVLTEYVPLDAADPAEVPNAGLITTMAATAGCGIETYRSNPYQYWAAAPYYSNIVEAYETGSVSSGCTWGIGVYSRIVERQWYNSPNGTIVAQGPSKNIFAGESFRSTSRYKCGNRHEYRHLAVSSSSPFYWLC
ncbi:hypothetical protein [Georgenia muralis]